jgi:hypothetical protein
MADPGHYAGVLRLIGQYLDDARAQEIELVDQGGHFTVSWQVMGPHRQQRNFRAFDLAQLLADAQGHRGHADQPRRLAPTIAEQLRTIGTECDRAGVEILTVRQTDEGLRITLFEQGCHAMWDVSLSEMQELIAGQRAMRGATGALALAGV